jgi:hypothetical protein
MDSGNQLRVGQFRLAPATVLVNLQDGGHDGCNLQRRAALNFVDSGR